MNYIIDEIDLLTLLTKCKNDPNLPMDLLDDFLKSKQPIELIAEGKASITDGYTEHVFVGGQLISMDYNFRPLVGKSIKLYIEVL